MFGKGRFAHALRGGNRRNARHDGCRPGAGEASTRARQAQKFHGDGHLPSASHRGFAASIIKKRNTRDGSAVKGGREHLSHKVAPVAIAEFECLRWPTQASEPPSSFLIIDAISLKNKPEPIRIANFSGGRKSISVSHCIHLAEGRTECKGRFAVAGVRVSDRRETRSTARRWLPPPPP